MEKYYIQAISSNLIEVLNQLAGNNFYVIEHESVKCFDRQGGPIIVPLWELPKNLYLEFKSRAKDYHFIDFGKAREGVTPRNIQEFLPIPRETIKFSNIRNIKKKKVLKRTSIMRRPVMVYQKVSVNQGVH